MNENYVLLIDEDEFEKFYKHCVPELGPDEVFFISLSARNKYLTEQERRDLELGRTEMFARRLIRQRDFSRFTRPFTSLRLLKAVTSPKTILTSLPKQSWCTSISTHRLP
jgi:hypothetical protein